MIKYRIFCVLMFVGMLVCDHAFSAQMYNPSKPWMTLESEHFAVHYPEELHNLAVRSSRIAEDVLGSVSDLFGYKPSGIIEIVLADISDDANGSAQVFPKNIIRLYVSAPTEMAGLSSYDDWLRILITHELAHICDIDQTWGIARILRHVFGKTIAVNGAVPQFLSEGVAVFAETLLTQTGRGRSSYVAMILRTAALEHQFLNIDKAQIQFSHWPGGYGPYFYGGMFHLWMMSKFGKEAVRDLHQKNASMMIPYLYDLAAYEVLGKTLPSLWKDFEKDETSFALDVANQIKEKGMTVSKRLTFHGRNIAGAHYTPDGKHIVYSRSSPVDGGTIRIMDRKGNNDRYLVLQTYSNQLSIHPTGKSIFYAQSAINHRFDTFDDLYEYHLDSQKAYRLREKQHRKKSLRARDPDIRENGNELIFVQSSMQQNKITIGTLDKHDLILRTVVEATGDIQHASPRWRPGHDEFVVSSWLGDGYRDILWVDSQNGHVIRKITHDKAQDGNPNFSKDGRYIFYESDRDGISNIYAFDTETSHYYRVTRVLGGAFGPDVSPDNQSLLFREASAIGFDIHEQPLNPQAWIRVVYTPEEGYVENASATQNQTPAWAQYEWPEAMLREKEPRLVLHDSEHAHAYSPFKTLLPFHDNWNLGFNIFSVNGDPTFTASTMGQDVLMQHTYAVTLGSSWFTHFPNWFMFYANDMTYPTLSVAGGQQAVSRPYGSLRLTERDDIAMASISVPILQRHALDFSYSFQKRSGPITLHRLGVTLGDFAYVSMSYLYHFDRFFPFSVSQEHGVRFSIAARAYQQAFGSDFDEILMLSDLRGFINNPWVSNHVLALRFVSAFAMGPDYVETFAMGGAAGSSALSTLSDRTYPLRGFALDFAKYKAGTGLLAAYAEYRFPLWHIERGFYTLPIYFERLHAAVFADSGSVFGEPKRNARMIDAHWFDQVGDHVRIGSGAEVRLDMNLSWGYLITLRLGVGFPVFEHTRAVSSVVPMWYFNFGSY